MFYQCVRTCLVSLFLAGSFLTPSVRAENIRARLVDESGKPVAGAVVTYASYPESGEAVADETGLAVFACEQVRPWLQLWAVSPDGKLLGKTYKLDGLVEGATTVPEMTLTLNDKVRIITGSVVDSEGKPLGGVTVGGARQTPVPYRVATDEQGRFQFTWPLDTALLSVYAIKPDVGFDFIPTHEPDDDITKYDPATMSNGPFTLKLRKAKTVSVRVVNAENQPLPGAHVGPWLIANPKTDGNKGLDDFNTSGGGELFDARTDMRGIAKLAWIPEESTSRITFCANGAEEGHLAPNGMRFYGDTTVRYDPHAPNAEAWWTDECTNGRCRLSNGEKWIQPIGKNGIVDFTLPLSARVAGTVRYSDGSPAPYVMISRKNHDQCGHGVRFTDAKGNFQIYENAGTKLNLAVESEKEATPALFAYDTGDGTQGKRLDIILQKGVTLRGKVAMPEGKAFGGEYCWIVIYEMNPDPAFPVDVAIRQTSILDAKGEIALYRYVLPPGKFKMRASSGPYVSDEIPLEIKPGDSDDVVLDIRLKERVKE